MNTANNLPIIRPDVMRMEYRQTVGGNALDKPTTGEKFKRFLGRLLSVGSSIGGMVARFFGPIGMAASAGLYGVKRLADNSIAKMDQKRAQDAAYDEAGASLQGMEFEAPGFNTFYQQAAVAPEVNGSPSVQWAPYTQGLEREINSSLNNKSGMTAEMLNQVS